MSDALRNGVGNPEWEDRWVQKIAEEKNEDEAWWNAQPRLRRRFRAFAGWEEGYANAFFPLAS